MKQKIIVPVILCGGSGSRLWPISQENRPKQFLNIFGEFSLLQETAMRALRITGAPSQNLVAVTLENFANEVETQFSEIDLSTRHILREPYARNTAAAIALAALHIERVFGPDAIMFILPSDHYIGDEMTLATAYRYALSATDYLVTFGIRPTRPHTGYGYIKIGDSLNEGAIHKAQAFIEKPDIQMAQKYIDSGDYFWNSGMFLFSCAAALRAYERYAHSILNGVKSGVYANIDAQPFDKAIMEKSDRVAVIPCDPLWSDVGSWQSAWEMKNKDAHGNAINGLAICYETHNCLIQGQNRLIACAGVENLAIIETPEALLIVDRRNDEAMRMLVHSLKKMKIEKTKVIDKNNVEAA